MYATCQPTRAAISSASAASCHGPDAPAVLRHAGPDAELARLERLDAIRIDHDVVGRAGDGHQDRRDSRGGETLLRIDQREVHDARGSQHAGEQQPRDALAQATDDGQPHTIHDPRPQPLQVVDEKGERECSHGALVDPVLREARRERRADQRIRRARGDAEKERRERRGLRVGAHARRNVGAPADGGTAGGALFAVIAS